VTTGASPMNRLVLVAMLGLLTSLIAELTGDSVDAWAPVASLSLALPPIVLSRRTFALATRLGSGAFDASSARATVRTILRQHLFCLACMTAVLAVQLASV
jgi:hypothetical protein